MAAALGYLEQALAIDSNYAAAMALAAYSRAQLVGQGWKQDLEAEAKEGLPLAWRAIELGKDDGNVFWMAAYAVLRLQKDVARAKELAYRSLELNPNSAIALGMAGRAELHSGNTSKALELLFRAQRLSPRAGVQAQSPSARRDGFIVPPLMEVGGGNSSLERDTGMLRTLAVCLVKQGQQSEAAAVARKVLDAEPQLTVTSLRARAMHMMKSHWNEFSAALRIAGIPE
jgi:tetratricopeptide (TPR) repeat protein